MPKKEVSIDSFKFNRKSRNAFNVDLTTSEIYLIEGDRLVRSGKTVKGGKKSDSISVRGTGWQSKMYFGGNFALGNGNDSIDFEGVRLSRVQSSRPEGVFDLGNGNDKFRNTEELSNFTVDLGKGDDRITSYNSYGLTLKAGAGNDVAVLESGSNSIVDMGEGDDIIYYREFGDDNSRYDGGPGRDTLVLNDYIGEDIVRDIATGTLTMTYSDSDGWNYYVFTGFEQIQTADGRILASI